MNRSIISRKARRKIRKDFELPLTSMMDMLIILVVFLLKSYSANAIAFATSPNIKLPTSSAEEAPMSAVNVLIEPQFLIVDGNKVVEFKNPPQPTVGPSGGAPQIDAAAATYEFERNQLGDGGRRILPLYDALVKAKDTAEQLMAKAVWKDKDGNIKAPKFEGTLIIHADKSVRYELLRKIMYTAGAAEFKVFKLVTVKKDAG